MIIDAHTHLFPPDVANRTDWYREHDTWFGMTHGDPLVRFPMADEMLQQMDEAGVDEAVVAGWPWQDPEVCAMHTEFLAGLPSRMHHMAIINPVSPEAATRVQQAASTGAVAIGELNADAQGFDWEDLASLSDFADACIHANMPVMIHASEPVGHPYAGKGTATPEKLMTFISAFPKLRVVLAHWGGGLPFYELMPEVRQGLQNVWYDTAATTYLYAPEVFDIVVRVAGAGKILFGSDYPVLGMKRLVQRTSLLGLGESDLLSILERNARAVYGLGGAL